MTEELRDPADVAPASASGAQTTGEADSSRITASAAGELWLGSMDLPGMDPDDDEE